MSEIADATPTREDAERLCSRLADRIEANGAKRPAVGQRWLDAARLLIDADERTEEQAASLIDWCQADEFWRTNILSMPKFREKYDQLLLKSRSNVRQLPGPDTSNDWMRRRPTT